MLVAAIVVSFNGEKDLPACLSSLQHQSIDVFLIDNGSTDSSIQIAEEFKIKHITPLRENLGFGAANNLGFQIAKGYDFYLLLNQDAYLMKDCLKLLVDAMQNHQDFGVISPLQLASDEKHLDVNFKSYLKGCRETDNLIETPFVNAAVWLVRAEVLKTVGVFDPEFFHYGEDRDYCNRLQFHGFKVGVLRTAKAVHAREQTMALTKQLMISKVKLKTIFTDPNLSWFGSRWEALKAVFGIPKYYFLKTTNLKYLGFGICLALHFLTLIMKVGRRLEGVKLRNKKKANG